MRQVEHFPHSLRKVLSRRDRFCVVSGAYFRSCIIHRAPSMINTILRICKLIDVNSLHRVLFEQH